MATNIQCESILAGIQKLEEYLQDKIVRESLELDRNAETSKYSDLLSRLKLILTQYTEREKNLVYVGFMGHFSTGKSSTINSLLGLKKGSPESRRVDLNPVDQSITLITHDKNRDSLLNITKESLVSIRSSFIENDFLENVVIADTPGTGDPILVHAIAQDFLPMCDLIVYFFSSTSALGSADISLLKEKSLELPFIPIKFVITRADEFRKDRKTEVSPDNFDNSKAQDFLNELGQRIRALFKSSSDINSDSFILVDTVDN
jgi:predicted GTPase